MVKINLNIKKKDLWLLSAIMVFLIGVGYVVAYNSGATPNIMGHSFGELELPACSEGQSLKRVSGTWQCGSFSFGTWVDVTAAASGGVAQGPAGSDGFVLAYNNNLPNFDLNGYSDSNPNPITLRARERIGSNIDGVGSITFPVRSGNYWKVTGATTVYWIPLGS